MSDADIFIARMQAFEEAASLCQKYGDEHERMTGGKAASLYLAGLIRWTALVERMKGGHDEPTT